MHAPAAHRLPLSVAVITRNEESRIRGLLESVAFAEEIVILDSGSTDSTLDVARSLGCRVSQEEWKGYGAQKNSAIQKCSHDWVLILDADERIPPETAEMIRRALADPKDTTAFSFSRKNHFHGRWVRWAGEWPDRQVRLVRKNSGSYRQTVHEEWVSEGPVRPLPASIEHHSHEDYAGWLRKMNSYSTLAARDMHASGRRAGLLSPALHGLGMFAKTYILKQGFREGLDGLAICTIKACGSFFKYAKLRELGRHGHASGTSPST